MRTWSEKTITDALALFALSGEAITSCESPEHANRFRLAIYNYIRRKRIEIQVQISISGVDVVMQPVPKMERAEIKEQAK